MTDPRIGMGNDIHALVEGRPLVLGGVNIPHEKGLSGHSDADALLHAIMDAILGSLALGDIGMHFPDTDAAFRGISSMILLERVREKMTAAGFRVGNLDVIILAERPRIAPFREAIRTSLANSLKIPIDRVSVKAGTREKFDAVGRGEAIECQAVVLLLAAGETQP